MRISDWSSDVCSSDLMSWATVLDRLLYGHSDAAHLVAPLAIATTLGRGRPAQPLSVPFVLGLNGNAITLRPELAQQEIGRASCRERVCQYVWIPVVAGSLKKKRYVTTIKTKKK